MNDLVVIVCPGCGIKLSVKRSDTGKQLRCMNKTCNKQFSLPKAAVATGLPPAAPKPQPNMRRRRAPIVAGAVCAIALLVVAAGTTIYLWQRTPVVPTAEDPVVLLKNQLEQVRLAELARLDHERESRRKNQETEEAVYAKKLAALRGTEKNLRSVLRPLAMTSLRAANC